MAARLHEAPPRASARRAGLPPAVDPVLARALSVEPEGRQASVGRLARELAAAASRAPATATAPMVPEVRRPPRRWAAVGAAAAVALVAGALGAAAAGLFGSGDGDAAGPSASGPATTSAAGTVTDVGPATTVVRTATAPAPAAGPGAIPGEATPKGKVKGKSKGNANARPVSFDRAQRMTDDAWAEIQRGRPEKAVKLMERAIPALAGSGDPYEGYAYYNLGRGLLDLGACEAAVPHLQASLGQPGSPAQLSERAEMLRRARDCAA
jgi:hypothetical protein